MIASCAEDWRMNRKKKLLVWIITAKNLKTCVDNVFSIAKLYFVGHWRTLTLLNEFGNWNEFIGENYQFDSNISFKIQPRRLPMIILIKYKDDQ